MAKIGRNDPCPCGSERKYKKCCGPKDEAARASSTQRARVPVRHRGHDFLASEGVSTEALDIAADYYERKARGEGPAEQMVDFSEPLLRTVGSDPELVSRAYSLGMLFWNLALLEDGGGREEALSKILERFESDQERHDFRSLAESMIARHHAMFPEMHESGSRTGAGPGPAT